MLAYLCSEELKKAFAYDCISPFCCQQPVEGKGRHKLHGCTAAAGGLISD